jgi:pimeloyl-ACP methyl ester carboxylesterase
MSEQTRIGNLTVLAARPVRAEHPPVLFVHGFYAQASVWKHWLPFFCARGFPAYAVNLRGRAGSRPGTRLGGVSVNDYVADAAEVAETLGRPVVVGHSMGGLIAQRLAELDAVRAAALIAPAPPRGIPLLSWKFVVKQLKVLPRALTSRVIDPNRDDLRELAFNCVPQPLQDVALGELVPDSGRAGRELSLTGVAVDRRRVRCPLLVVAGERDRFIPARIAARVARRYGVPLRTIPEHGHMVIIEPEWETLAGDLADWIAHHR